MRNLLRNFVLAAAAVAGAVSCTESEVNDNIKPTFEGVTLHAATPGSKTPSTKVDFTDNGKDGINLEWSANDSFVLYDADGAEIDTFTTVDGEGDFVSSNPELQLVQDATYTAKFNGEATTAEQNGDEINNLNKACQMEAEFTYADDAVITFAHTKAIMTFKFTSEERPAYLIFEDGDKSYKVTYSELTPDADDIYTSHIMIEPSEATSRTLTFTLYDSDDKAYDIRETDTSLPFEKGKRYTSPVSELPLINNSWTEYAAETFANNKSYAFNHDEYTITSAEELALLAKLMYEERYDMRGKTFTLANDIDLSGHEWVAIGYSSRSVNSYFFMGTFEGNGHTISGLYIDNPDSRDQGLFGYTNNATIKNLSVVGSVTGNSNVAGVVGDFVQSTIINCSSAVSVNGNSFVGGVVGGARWSKVINCYNSAPVECNSDRGDSYVGGVVGWSSSTEITNCYNSASVIGDRIAGGVVGGAENSIITSCYWNTDAQDVPNVGISRNSGTPSNVVGMTSAKMQDSDLLAMLNSDAYVYNKMRYNNSKTPKVYAWRKGADGFPVFDRNNYDPTYTAAKLEGEGTESSPYRISTADDLRNLAKNALSTTYEGKYFVVTQNIDLGGFDDNGNGIYFYEFIPIGFDSSIYFGGTFDGAGHTISGLLIDNQTADRQGLFGYVRNATIKNLSVAGKVTGNDEVAGVAGNADASTFANCHNAVEVEGREDFGGIVGYSSKILIINCYNTASVAGHPGKADSGRYVGGIAGYLFSSTINNCYNAANVSGSFIVGDIVGSTGSSKVINSYWNTSKSAIGSNFNSVIDVERMTTAEMQDPSFAIQLNNGAYYCNNPVEGDKTKVEACAWRIVDDTPVLDFGVKPSIRTMEYNAADNVYEIYSYKGLKEFATKVNDEVLCTINGKLMCSINLNGSESNPWTPIGRDESDTYAYKGTFDGNGHKISGLYVKGTNIGKGLFTLVKDGTIKNLTVSGEVNSSANNVGGIAGSSYNARFENCTNNAKISGAQYVGGIVGLSSQYASTIFVRCVNNGNIHSNGSTEGDPSSYAGGIVGSIYGYKGNFVYSYVERLSQIISCANRGNVYASTSLVGGLTGLNIGGLIRNSYNLGAVSNDCYGDVGGIVGANMPINGTKGLVENCYSSGKVSGEVSGDTNYGTIGVVAGSNHGISCISSCYYDSSKGKAIGKDNSASQVVEAYTSLTSLLTNLNSFATEQGLDSWVAGDDGYPILEFEK